MKKKTWLIVILLGLLVVLPSKGVAESTAVVWYDVVVKVFSDGTYIATLFENIVTVSPD